MRTDQNAAAITWRRHDEHCIRSEDACYWISRAPVMGRMVYTAAWRPQNDRADGLHLGCHPDADRAKAACAAHAAGQLEAIA